MTIKVFQFKPYVVVTESMEPVLDVDDLIIVTNPKVDELEVGDIITFRADIDYNGTKEIVTHYVNSITETNGEYTIRTNRYGSTVPDTWILSGDDVIGVYSFRVKQLGVFINFVKSPFGIAAIAVNVIVIGAIVYIVKSGKKEGKQENKPEAQDVICLNDLMTTEELVKVLHLQASKPIQEETHKRVKKDRTRIKKVGRIAYFVVLGIMALWTLYAIIPMVVKDRAVNLLGRSTMLVIPNDQELDQELNSDVIHIKKFSFDDIEVGDRIIIYGKFGTDLYWMEEIVAKDELNRSIDTTFGYFIRNTYEEDHVVATFDHHANLLITILYVATTPRGFASMLFIEAIALSVIYYYFVRNPKEKK